MTTAATPCPSRWGRWLSTCKPHECVGSKGHFALCRCRVCGRVRTFWLPFRR